MENLKKKKKMQFKMRELLIYEIIEKFNRESNTSFVKNSFFFKNNNREINERIIGETVERDRGHVL